MNVGIVEATLKLKDEWTAQLKAASKDLGKWATDTGDQLEKAGRAVMPFSLAIGAVGGLSIKAASDFESSFAGIKKTVQGVVDDAGQITVVGKEIQQAFRDMAKELPTSVNDLNDIGAAAGQLGIKSNAIVGFTKVMADLGETTNLTALDAATAAARIQNIFGAAGKDTDRLGSSLVALGNTSATTERDIIAMTLRIAGAGNQIGLTQAEVMGIGAALSSVGIEAEAGGSAISKVMIDMALAVQTGSGRLKDFAEVAFGAGASGQQFAKAFSENAAGALNSFVSGLGNMKAEGGSALKVLDDMEITEVRMRDALLRASGAGDLMTRSIQTGTQAWNENVALTKEAEQRYSTFESQLKMAKNQLVDVGIEIGTALLPILRDLLAALKPVISWLAEAAKWFGQLPGPVKALALVFGTLAAAVGPVLWAVGSLLSAVGVIAPYFAAGTTGATVLAGALSLLTWPVAAVAAAVVALGYVWNRWGDDIKRIVTDAYTAVKTYLWDKFEPVLTPVMALLSSIGQAFNAFGDVAGVVAQNVFGFVVGKLVRAFEWMRDTVASAIGIAKGIINSVPDALLPLLGPIGLVVAAFRYWDEITATVSAVYNAIKTYLVDKFTGVVDAIKSKVDAVTNFFRSLYTALGGGDNAAAAATKALADAQGQATTSTVALTTETAKLPAVIKPTVKLSEEAAAALKKYNEQVKGLADELSGAKAQGELKLLEAAFKSLPPAQQAAILTTVKFTDRLRELAEAGANLGPAFASAVHTADVTAQRWTSMINLMGLMSRVKKDSLATEKDWREEQIKSAIDISDAKRKLMDTALSTSKAMHDAVIKDSMNSTDFAIYQAGLQRDQTLAELAPLKTAWPAIYESARTATLTVYDKSVSDAKLSATKVVSAWGQALANLPATILGALQGGGNVLNAVTSSLGSALFAPGSGLNNLINKGLSSMATSVGGKFAANLASSLSSAIPGIGALVGPALTKLGGALIGMLGGGNNTKKDRDAAARVMGFSSAAGLYDALNKLGPEGAALAHAGLNKIGKNDTAANNAWLKQVEELFAKTKASAAEAQEAIQKLKAEAAEMLPTWDEAGELAEKYGIDLEALGPKFKQGGLSAAASEVYTDFERLAAFIGEDMNEGVLRGMADEISGLVSKALAFGGEVPKQMQPMIARLQEMGLLLDENGNKIEGVENLKFGETMQETTLELVKAMKELAAIMRGDVTKSVNDVAEASKGLKRDLDRTFQDPFRLRFEYDLPDFPDVPGDGPKPPTPGFHGGTHGRYVDFGRETLVRLHGKEKITPQGAQGDGGGGGGGSAAGGTSTTIINIDGRTMARVVTPWLPGSVREYGVR